ncbi:MAG: type II toxin-antitoxin system prevent-host-death family antitoxin [Proteobacteria bacterium]|nr:type II toxin-antitoxin system prevent-host-death family antitoxin [Pseudomonadota bacterium]
MGTLNPVKIAVHEARNSLGALLDRALDGEEVFLTRHGEVEVQLVPVPGKRKVTAAEIRAAFKGLRAVSDFSARELLKESRDW